MKQQDFDLLDIGGFFNSLFEHASINAMLLMTLDGIMISVNKAFTSIFGYEDKDIVNKHFSMLFTKEDRESGRPEIELRNVKDLGSAQDKNFIIHINGHKIWASGETILVNNKRGDSFLVKVIQNLHEQKLLENFLSDSNDLLENILMTISDALILIAPDGTVLKINAAFADLFETTAEAFEKLPLNKTGHSFWASGSLQQIVANVLAETDQLYKQTFFFNRSNGKKRIISISSTFLTAEDTSPRQVLFTIQDITEAKLNEKRKKDMIGFISHELRNPLTRLNLATQMIRESTAGQHLPEINNYLKIAETVSTQLNGLVSELHDATKAGYHKLQMKKSHFSYDGFVHEVIESAKVSWPGTHLAKQGSVGIIIYADKQRLEQVLTNYISNAVKYGGKDNRIIISVEETEGSIITCVKDFGRGIKQENLKYLFRRLYRVDEKTEGLGLGLYLSKQIIKAHNGKVWVESEPGKGSSFYFSLPVKRN